MKRATLLILLFILFISASSYAQFETKKVRFKAIRGYLFHNPIQMGEIKFHSRIKIGFGLPQGVLGINAEFGIDRIALTAGIGYAKFKNTPGTLGFHVGLRGYILSNEKQFRPRLSAHYGLSNRYVENEISTSAYGPTVGIGFEHKVTDFIVYDIEYTFRINALNTYRPSNNALESIASPHFGIGVYF